MEDVVDVLCLGFVVGLYGIDKCNDVVLVYVDGN